MIPSLAAERVALSFTAVDRADLSSQDQREERIMSVVSYGRSLIALRRFLSSETEKRKTKYPQFLELWGIFPQHGSSQVDAGVYLLSRTIN